MPLVRLAWSVRAVDPDTGRATGISGRVGRRYSAEADSWPLAADLMVQRLFKRPGWVVTARVTGVEVTERGTSNVSILVTVEGDWVGRSNWLRDQYAVLASRRPGQATRPVAVSAFQRADRK